MPDYRDDDRRDCGYCPHCGKPLTGVTRAALGYCEIHGWVWADWEPVYAPPKITCCDSAKATGGAYHALHCPVNPPSAVNS